jgi:hypothetical protein
LNLILIGEFDVIVILDWKLYIEILYLAILTLLDHELSIEKVVDLLIDNANREAE